MSETAIFTYFYFIDRFFGFRNYRGHSFFDKSLNSTSKVLDLGGNIGEFSKSINSKYKCETFIIEASPYLFSQIDESPAMNKYNYAVGGKNGSVTFYESTNIKDGNIIAPKSNSSGNTFEVECRDFSTLVSELNLKEIDLLKIDIEGAEIELFDHVNKEDLKSVKQITIEFHDSIYIPNVSTDDANRTIDNIMSMGFEGIQFGHRNFNWLFMNKKQFRLNALTKLYLSMRNKLTKLSIFMSL